MDLNKINQKNSENNNDRKLNSFQAFEGCLKYNYP